jgi:hypothetical protein
MWTPDATQGNAFVQRPSTPNFPSTIAVIMLHERNQSSSQGSPGVANVANASPLDGTEKNTCMGKPASRSAAAVSATISVKHEAIFRRRFAQSAS